MGSGRFRSIRGRVRVAGGRGNEVQEKKGKGPYTGLSGTECPGSPNGGVRVTELHPRPVPPRVRFYPSDRRGSEESRMDRPRIVGYPPPRLDKGVRKDKE